MSSMPPFYKTEIGQRLKPAMRTLLEDYSGLPADQVEEHIYSIRERAWNIQPFPCIGEFQFLTPHIFSLSCYKKLVDRVKNGAVLLDLGCCFGQDLRYLAAEGVETSKWYASDLEPQFWELGYALFRDKDKMHAQFLAADVLKPDSSLSSLSGMVDIVIASQLLHLFSWEEQVAVGKRVVNLTKPGAWFVGYQIGSSLGRQRAIPTGTGGSFDKETSIRFFHNERTFKKWWEEVEEQTASKWTVEVTLHDLKDWIPHEDFVWMDPDARLLEYCLCRSA